MRKLFVDRTIRKDTIKSTLLRGWRPDGTTMFKTLRENLFLLEFEHAWDKERVLEGRPWVFEGQLFAMEVYNGFIDPACMDFE